MKKRQITKPRDRNRIMVKWNNLQKYEQWANRDFYLTPERSVCCPSRPGEYFILFL